MKNDDPYPHTASDSCPPPMRVIRYLMLRKSKKSSSANRTYDISAGDILHICECPTCCGIVKKVLDREETKGYTLRQKRIIAIQAGAHKHKQKPGDFPY